MVEGNIFIEKKKTKISVFLSLLNALKDYTRFTDYFYSEFTIPFKKMFAVRKMF